MSKGKKILGPRKGFRLFCWNLWYNLIPLMIVNFLFVLLCIPVVTAGPACAALSRICCLLASEQPFIYPLREFWDTFRNSFRQGFASGALGIGYLVAVSYCFWLLDQQGNTSLLLRLILLLALLAFSMCMMYVFAQIAMLKLPLKKIFDNAVRLMLVRLKESVAALLLGSAVVLVPLYFMPVTLLLYLALLFSASALVSCSLIWPGIGMYLVKEEDEPQNNQSR